MNDFLAAAFTMPTTIFSVLLGLVILCWLTVLLGLFDLEIFESLFGAFEGGAEGAVEGMAEGVAEGIGEGVAEGIGDGAVEGAAGRPGCLGLLAVGEVPVTLTGSLLVFFAWAFSYGGVALLAKIAVGGTLAVVGLGFAAVALAIGLTAVATKPLRKLFHIAPVTLRRDLVKRMCKLTTLRVDEKFGQAEVEDNGAGLLLQVRCRLANELTRGSRAIIYEYDAGREVFWIVPLNKDLSETYKAHGAKALERKSTRPAE